MGWLEGEDDSPLPKRAGMMMKYLGLIRKSLRGYLREREEENGSEKGRDGLYLFRIERFVLTDQPDVVVDCWDDVSKRG